MAIDAVRFPPNQGRRTGGDVVSCPMRDTRRGFSFRFPPQEHRRTMVETITSFVVPVVMISANGLLCLAFYNRLAAVIARLRAINKERFDLFTRLATTNEARPESPDVAHILRRLEILDELGHLLFARVRLIRDALICLLATVLLMLGCSLALGMTSLASTLGWLPPTVAWVAPALFVTGIVVMMAGIWLAICELRNALATLSFEHDMLERSQRENGNGLASNGG